MAMFFCTACPGPIYRSIECGILDGDARDQDIAPDNDGLLDEDALPWDDIVGDDDIPPQPVILQWGSSGDEVAAAVEAAPDGTLFVTGGTTGEIFGNQNSGSSDIFLTRIAPDHSFQWTLQWGSSNFDQALTISRGDDGSLYLSGMREAVVDPFTGTGIGRMFIARHSPEGKEIWRRQWGSFDSNHPSSAVTTLDGTTYVAGWVYGTVGENDNKGFSDIFLSRFDQDGTERWSIQWGSGLIDAAYGVVATTSGWLYVTGLTYGVIESGVPWGGNDIFLSKVTTGGGVAWTRQWGSSGEDRSYALATDAAGNLYLAGSTSGGLGGFSNIGGLDCFLMKFSSDGILLWTYQWGTEKDEEIYALASVLDGEIYAVGYANAPFDGAPHRGKRDILISRFSSDGEPRGHHLYGTSADEAALAARSSPPYLVIAGGTSGNLGAENAGGYDIFVILHPLP